MSIYFSLMTAGMVSLICTSILSVKVSCGRMRAADSADQAMYSLFARYDRKLMQNYDLFFLDAGGAGGGPCVGAALAEVESAMDAVLDPGKDCPVLAGRSLLTLVRTGGYVCGYTLATDAGGAPFEAQAISAMKDTAGIEALSLLKERTGEAVSSAEAGESLLAESSSVSYQEIQECSEETRTAAEEEGVEIITEVPEDFVNPLPALETLKRGSVMDLVLPDGRAVSGKAVDPASLVSGRDLQSGVGVIDASGGSGGSSMYFKGWILAHFKDFTEPEEACGLTYQLEYLLAGKPGDRENLKSIITRLLLLREAANIACLYGDAQKSAELTEMAGLISIFLLIPEAEPLIKLLLAAGWAYAESLVDVRGLLEGKRVAAVKSAANWQTDLEGLAQSGGDISGLAEDMPGGLTYREYLAGMLMVTPGRKLLSRSMDLVESHMQGLGRPSFRLDSCICALSVEIQVRSENMVTFPVVKELSYQDL